MPSSLSARMSRRPLLRPSRLLPLAVIGVVLLVVSALPVAAGVDVQRLAGPTRIETAVEISQDTYPTGNAGAVVLARSGDFPDALAGAPLAAARRAPLLLTPTDVLAPVVADEMQRVLDADGTVFLLGGPVALSAEVERAVADLGYQPQRLAGPTRYETSLAIAREAAPEPAFITIADGNDFPDALIGGSLASAFADSVMVLTAGDTLPETVSDYLDANSDADFGMVTIGPAAGAAVPEPFNVQGPDPAARSVAAAEAFYSNEVGGVSLASQEAFPDGLAGGPHAFRNGSSPLLLTAPDELPQVVAEYVATLTVTSQSHVYGGNLAINESVVDGLRAALAGS